MNSPKIPRRPILTHQTLEDKSTHSDFLKRNYKYLRTLRMDFIPINLRVDCYSHEMQGQLLKLSKKYKKIYKLCLMDFMFCSHSPNAKDILKVIKKFRHINSINLPLVDSPAGQVDIAKTWLKQGKFLKSLTCKIEPQRFRFLIFDVYKEYKKLFRTIRLNKLHELSFTSKIDEMDNLSPLAFLKALPSTLKRVCFNFPVTDFMFLEGINLANYPLYLPHLDNLQSFHMDFIVPLRFIKTLLSKIPNLPNFKSLYLRLDNSTSVKDTDLDDLMEVIKVCSKLESLTLKLLIWPRKIDSWNFLLQCPLKYLRLESNIKGGQNLLSLAEFLSGTKELRYLSLKVVSKDTNSRLTQIDNRHFHALFEAIGKMEQLESLEVYSESSESCSRPSGLVHREHVKVIGDLCACLEKLGRLKELAIRLAQGQWNDDFGSFMKVLKGKHGDLEKLEIHVEGSRLGYNDWKLLVKTVQVMGKLREFTLGGFNFDEEQKFELVSQMVLGLKRIQNLQILNCVGNRELECFTGMLNQILAKNGLKNFRCNKLPVCMMNVNTRLSDIDFLNILDKNRWLRNVDIPFENHNLIFHLLRLL